MKHRDREAGISKSSPREAKSRRSTRYPDSYNITGVRLQRSGIIDPPLAATLHGMVGFRNVAIHQYDQLDMDVLRWVIESVSKDLDTPRSFCNVSGTDFATPDSRDFWWLPPCSFFPQH